jgi:hypothetical protein
MTCFPVAIIAVPAAYSNTSITHIPYNTRRIGNRGTHKQAVMTNCGMLHTAAVGCTLVLVLLPSASLAWLSTAATRAGQLLSHSRAISGKRTMQQQPLRAIVLRNWEEGDDVYGFLKKSIPLGSSFDPEGPLETDVVSEAQLKESYRTDDNCFFLCAIDDADDSRRIMGTAGLITGTQVTYMKSGSSMASYVTTGAIRRVTVDPSLDPVVQESTLDALLREVDRRAQRTLSSASLNEEDESVVNQLIVLAYPDTTLRPTAPLLEKLGYQGLDTELGEVIQYQKVLTADSNDDSKSEEPRPEVASVKTESGVEKGFILLAATGISSFTFLGALWTIVQVLGLDASISSSSMNRGIGTPLTTQELGSLMQDETLKRTTLLDDESSSVSKLEDLREDDAMMKIITGQDVRMK